MPDASAGSRRPGPPVAARAADARRLRLRELLAARREQTIAAYVRHALARHDDDHADAVAVYARDIASALGLPPGDRRLAFRCGRTHDIGKIGLRRDLLDKRGPLTARERREVERHPAIGERILAILGAGTAETTIVRHHHERFDGRGYPDGLAGERIPLLSRILAVADTYSAMTSDRPYRRALAPAAARGWLAGLAGTQFDPRVVAAFDAILNAADEDYRLGRGRGFTAEAAPRRPATDCDCPRGRRYHVLRWA